MLQLQAKSRDPRFELNSLWLLLLLLLVFLLHGCRLFGKDPGGWDVLSRHAKVGCEICNGLVV